MNQESSPPEVQSSRVAADRQLLIDAKARGRMATFGAWIRLSGPGWLQGAITLGGNSLAGSLYLGVLAGFSLMWLQPLAMIMGVIMLSAIGYVVLSTGERPFVSINKHVNPVLGWGWAIATLMANLVWTMPQFSLATAAMRQNLAPGLVGAESGVSDTTGVLMCIAALFIVATIIVWFYDSGGWGIKLFEILLKVMVAAIVLCFFGVVLTMSWRGVIDWPSVFAGYIPDLSLLTQPAPSIRDAIEATGQYADHWTGIVLSQQRDVMVTAAATAVGINMTFLMPYSMLAKGWDKTFRGLAIFDLATGLFIPFMLATSCVVIASATQFHHQPAAGVLGETDANGKLVTPAPNAMRGYLGLVDGRLAAEIDGYAALSDTEKQALRDKLPTEEKRMAAMLVKRDAFDLAQALEPLTGKGVAQYLFGFGVVGMALSTIIILMLINGFVFCEMLGVPARGWPHRIGALLAVCTGATGPFLFAGQARFWLSVPTSVFGMMLLPIAYITFFALLNQRKLLGDAMPRGFKRLLWNVLTLAAVSLATFGAAWSIWSRTQLIPGTQIEVRWVAIGFILALTVLGLIIHVRRKARAA
ncbi:hypothetical protein HED60_16030 [Planctomycetales bacterium ZRK34]|nr:hypothetical protein HED60_16030 [Planctomycetales bacterium ZRK34]